MTRVKPSINILGISAFYHDSAACLVRDGEIIAAAQEERFTRKKHDAAFPREAVKYCLKEAGIHTADLDYVGFYDKPFVKFERILETYLSIAPKGLSQFLSAMPIWLKEKLWTRSNIRNNLGYYGPVLFSEHHESHAASAFYPSPFKEAAILTMDGVGEWATSSIAIGRGNKIELIKELRFPHSLGLLYSAFTYYLGFKVNSGEYKVMGLAPYGKPEYTKVILNHLVDLKEDGSFRMNQDYFDYIGGLTMTNKKFGNLFGAPTRKPESKLTQKEMDIAASLQEVTEEIMLRMSRHIRKLTGMKNLCLAGGVALNCVGNGKILKEKIFDKLWIQPAAGDAGGALGVAMCIWHQVLENKRQVVEEAIHEEEALKEKEESIKQMEQESKELSRKIQELTEMIAKVELKRSEINIQLVHIEERTFEDFNVTLPELKNRPQEEFDVQEVDHEMRELKQKIGRMGEVNLAALSDFKTTDERYQFLKTQQEDLADSIHLLHQTIRRINRTTKQRFLDTFEKVNENFKEIFAQLFRGGKAKLSLTDESNPLESGVEISANPLGKQMQNLTLLSGGEKAMTAIALVFSVFKVRPSPFCLLDEVDAPLDEANVIRFQEMLKQMSENTQFILITHNQKTMSFADVLYGITMEERGVSKAVSVNLN